MDTEKRTNIYDSVRVGIRGLTAIIALGLVMLGLLMAYGYYLGQKDKTLTVGEDVDYEAAFLSEITEK